MNKEVIIVFLWAVIVLQWVVLIYIPLVCLVGIVMGAVTTSAMAVIENPYFGLVRVLRNKAILIWSVRLVLLGTILFQYARWYQEGVSPFIPL